MLPYIARRVVLMIVGLWVISLVVFLALNVLPGDAATVALGQSADEQARALFRARLGLDQPLHLRYLHWFAGVVRGDLGQSYFTGSDVGQELLSRLPLTLELALLATIISGAIGLPAGILAATYHGRSVDLTVSILALMGLATPSFWLATLLVLLLSVKLQLLPSGGYVPFSQDPVLNLRLMLMPAFALGLVSAAIVMRMVRTSMLEVLQQDYIRTARAKGLPVRLVIIRHALKNAMAPAITVAALEASAIFGGTVLIEQIFLLPGVGKYILLGVQQRDFAIVQAGVLVMVVAVQIINLGADVANAWLDPRRRGGPI